MDIALKSLYNECIYGVDSFQDDGWIDRLLKNVTRLEKEILSNQANVPLLNLLLQNQYKISLSLGITDIVKSGFDVEEGRIASSKTTLKTLKLFQTMQWHTVYAKQYMSALITLVEAKITMLCSDSDFNLSIKANLDDWISDNFFSYVSECFGSSSFLPTAKKELRFAATDFLVKLRSKELFEMIAEYPDSLVSLKELRDDIKHTDNIALIGKSFRAVLRKRLLHMGASTSQILDFYVSMIKALRVLDPSDFLLNFVAVPVRSYLLGRKDAVRCIVASLTEGKESELHGELKQGGNLAYAADEDDDEAGPGLHWEPRKRNRELVETAATDRSARGLDTLALLVSIYGSTDLFIVEFRSLLADKLLSNVTYATDQEVANLELLKIRYGPVP
jgi:anaphase-promoting complex subunit 2